MKAGPLVALGMLEVLRYMIDLAKFSREASYHTWSSKLWGIALFAGFYCLLVMGIGGVPLKLAIYLGIVADLEGIVISLVLPAMRSDIPSFVHALRSRANLQAR
jgi:CDP-diacylglycerol--glycerol-3-phosphate 3-phosphatidyltransferase